jgi:hypothetical protein
VDLEAVTVELEAALAMVPSLAGRVLTVGDKANAPSAFVTYPAGIDFDQTYGRGEDSMELQAVVVAGRTVARATRKTLAAYCNGSGAESVKTALEGFTYTTCDVVTVPHIDFDVQTIAAVDYMAAIFTIKITGRGA